jgi:hypothetical protein
MKDLFEPNTAAEILSRLQKLQANTPPQWGKMNASQMMAHCQRPIEVFFGEKKLKQSLIGILFGRMAKKKLFADKPWSKGLPTAPEFLVKDEREFQKEKTRLTDLINRMITEGPNTIPPVHPFFGKMSLQEWSILGYKHLDHHFRQFGA